MMMLSEEAIFTLGFVAICVLCIVTLFGPLLWMAERRKQPRKGQSMSLDVFLTRSCCGSEIYSRKITHNLHLMAEKAGIYDHLWRPDEIGITTAEQLIGPLLQGWMKLRADREGFERFDPPNGYGCYDELVDFVLDYLSACRRNPTAKVGVHR